MTRRLATWRSHLRLAGLMLVFSGFGFVATVSDASGWIRVVAGLIAAFGAFQAVDYIVFARRWDRTPQEMRIPTLFHPQRRVPAAASAEIGLADYWLAATLEVRPTSTSDARSTVPVNMFVSRHDLVRWLGT